MKLTQPLRTIPVTKIEQAENPVSGSHAALSETTHFSNKTRKSLTITFRHGISFTIPPAWVRSTDPYAFVVQKRWVAESDVNIDVYDRFNETPILNLEIEALKKSILEHSVDGPGVRQKFFGLDYYVAQDVLEHGEPSYIPELDVVVTFGTENHAVPIHPYSEEGIAKHHQSGDYLRKSVEGAGIGVDIVDNDNEYGDHFLNVAGKVYRIPAIVDPNRANGIYVFRTLHEGERSTGNAFYKRYKKLSEVKDLHLYKTHSEALALGDEQSIRERELKELEYKNKLLTAEISKEKTLRERELASLETERSREKNEHASKVLKYERELTHMKLELSRMESESAKKAHEFKRLQQARDEEIARIKHQFEMQSLSRRESSEWIKWVPAILTAVTTTIFGIEKIMSSRGNK